MATVRYRQNNIARFSLSDGTEITEHDEKAAVLWSSFKERLGVSNNNVVPEEILQLVQHIQNLNELSAHFTNEEIDKVVASLPIDKAPGPDGFNGQFIKSCWHIIKMDFYNMCKDFQEGNISLQCLNDSIITLIPKKSSPETPHDYRPISLLNSCLKLLTKLLANRFQSRILDVVHKHQYGFIKSRTIQDCLAWSFEYLHHCKSAPNGAIIMKLDFEKAFDLIEHSAILQVLKQKGFDDIWISWIDNILKTGTSAVLLNGIPGKKFACKRGVRQGDPLSPLLFASTADLLQTIINCLCDSGHIEPPVKFEGHDFPIVQYADDTLLFMEAQLDHLEVLKQALHNFQLATGLKVNFQKSCLVPVNIDETHATALAHYFGCSVGKMPFTYLGLPLGTTRPTVMDLAPLADSVERRLNACSRFLNYGGRLTFVNSVLSALPTFYMCMLKLNKTIVKTIDRGRRHCLWAKKDKERHNSLAAWEMVCKPKDKGGLGVINLEIQNDALLLKHLFKFFNHAETPWVQMTWQAYYQNISPQVAGKVGSFWWRDVCGLITNFRSVMTCNPGNGSTALFWKDRWGEELMADRFARLFSFSLDTDVILQSMLDCEGEDELVTHFAIPMSEQAYAELIQVGQLLSHLRHEPELRASQD
jgi:hypothetical protein